MNRGQHRCLPDFPSLPRPFSVVGARSPLLRRKKERREDHGGGGREDGPTLSPSAGCRNKLGPGKKFRGRSKPQRRRRTARSAQVAVNGGAVAKQGRSETAAEWEKRDEGRDHGRKRSRLTRGGYTPDLLRGTALFPPARIAKIFCACPKVVFFFTSPLTFSATRPRLLKKSSNRSNALARLECFLLPRSSLATHFVSTAAVFAPRSCALSFLAVNFPPRGAG